MAPLGAEWPPSSCRGALPGSWRWLQLPAATAAGHLHRPWTPLPCPRTSPMYFCTSSPPDTRMKVQSVWCATARASSVLPGGGGAGFGVTCVCE